MNKVLRSFLSDYEAEPSPDKRLERLAYFINYYNYSNFGAIEGRLHQELDLCTRQNHWNGIAFIRMLFAYVSFEKGEFDVASKKMEWVNALYERISLYEIKAQILNFMAFLHSHQGNFDKAFEYCYASIAEAEKAADKRYYDWGNYTLGVFYFDLKDYRNAEKHFLQGLEGFQQHGNQFGAARCETGLSTLCIENQRYPEAEMYLERSLAYYDLVEETPGQSRSLNDLGVIYRKTGKPMQALGVFERSLELRKKINHTQGIATSLNEIAEVLILLHEFERAQAYLEEARDICEHIQNKSKLYRTHYLFTQLYRHMGQPWKALEHYDLYESLKSAVVGEAANNKMKALETRMVMEKAEREKEIERLKNEELKKAYNIIGEKNTAITDSINYARRIQLGLLPSEADMQACLGDYMVLYRPKDIVSGDFYWCDSVYSAYFQTQIRMLAVFDCTGHGVPGAFMSILGYTLLNQAIKNPEIRTPDEVLDFLKTELPRILKARNSDAASSEGMDIALCMIDPDRKRLYYAGAKHPLWILRRGAMEIEEIKGTRFSIGGLAEVPIRFPMHEIACQPGDTFYLFTDGVADQFGGAENKRLSTKRLKAELIRLRALSLPDQKKEISRFLEQWQGSLAQVDDMLLLGFRME